MNTHDRMAEEIDDLQRANALKDDVIAELQAERQSIKARLAAVEAKWGDKPAEPAKPKTLRDVVADSYGPYKPTATTVTDALLACAAVLRHEAEGHRGSTVGADLSWLALTNLANHCEREVRPC